MIDHTLLFLLLGLVASVLLAMGLAMMKSRSAALPEARGARLLRTVARWLGDPVWLGGLALQTVGYAIFLVALSRAPVSLLAVTMQGGIALFVVIAVWLLGERASAGEWLGIAGIVGAIVLLGFSLGGPTPSVLDSARLLWLSLAAVALAIGTSFIMKGRRDGVASAIASGLAFGMGSLYAKALVGNFSSPTLLEFAVNVLRTPWTYLAVAANLTGLVMLQNSFHAGRGIIVMPLSSACSNIVPIVGGILAFGERLPASTSAAMLRLAAFGLTIVAGGLLATARD